MDDYNEIEKRILDMWPKFEDGCYVQLGDKAVANSGENKGREFIVRNVYFENGHGKLRSSVSDGCYWTWKAADACVKRPAPKVRDANWVEIEVGDRVYSIANGNSYIVRSVNCSGTIELEGFDDKGWSPKFFTHMQPAIDADGVIIKAGDTVYDAKGEGHIVKEVYFDDDESHERTVWCGEFKSGIAVVYIADQLTHTRPDSWERLEKDAEKSTCEYFGSRDMECSECPGFKGGVKGCSVIKMRDLIRRAKAIAEKEAGR